VRAGQSSQLPKLAAVEQHQLPKLTAVEQQQLSQLTAIEQQQLSQLTAIEQFSLGGVPGPVLFANALPFLSLLDLALLGATSRTVHVAVEAARGKNRTTYCKT
jgi:hypothetical protein